MPLKLNVIVGSTRPGRAGPAIGRWVTEFADEHGAFIPEFVDIAAFDLPLLDEPAHPRLQRYEHAHTRNWAASVASADAYVFVTPEYDHFPPAALVNAIQLLVREWGRKPAGVVSYGGISGGLRATEQLRLLVSSVNVHAVPNTVPLPRFPEFITDAGTFSPSDPVRQGMTGMLDELSAWGGALQSLRAAA